MTAYGTINRSSFMMSFLSSRVSSFAYQWYQALPSRLVCILKLASRCEEMIDGQLRKKSCLYLTPKKPSLRNSAGRWTLNVGRCS